MKKLLYNLFVALITLTLLPQAFAADWTKEDTAQLVSDVRHPPIQECWSIMKGTVKHTSNELDKTLKIPIEVRARFSARRSLAQVIFDKQERYLIGQNFADGIKGTSVITEQKAAEDETSLQDVGLRPSDLTLSFLYWDYLKDDGKDSYKTMACRILVFHHPDSDEKVRVWVSLKHRFPLLVKWYKGDDESPYRQLDLKDLKEVNGVYMISRVEIKNPGWKTQVRFTDISLEPLKLGDPVPDDLFILAN